MADTHNTAHAQWKFNALYADTEVRSVADDKLLAVVRAGPEKARILGLLKAAETPGTALLRGEGEQFTRFCPGCGSVGDVESKFRDCCPDGSGARLIPESLAQKCHDLFRLALVGASQQELIESQPNAALADGWMPIETAPRDGTMILLWEEYSGAPVVGFYAALRGRWLADTEHYDTDGDACVIDRLSQDLITHWRPLPAPPTLNASKEQQP